MGSKTRTIMEKQAKINFDNNLNQQTSQQFYTMNPYCQTQMQYPQQQVYQHSDSTTSHLNSCISSSSSSNWKNELLSIPSPSPEDFKYSAFECQTPQTVVLVGAKVWLDKDSRMRGKRR